MKRLIMLGLSLLCAVASVRAATPEQETDALIAGFSQDPGAQNQALEALAWKGISDPRLFDMLAQRIKDEAVLGQTDGVVKDRVARSIRALGFSGLAKYNELLVGLDADRTYSRYAEAAIIDLYNYQRWNPIIADRTHFNPAYSDDANRVLNMLRADDLLLNRIAGKRVYFAIKDDVVLDALAERIKATYMRRGLSSDQADGIAWMVKGLGSSANPKYRALLEEIAASKNSDSTVVRHARNALEKYYGA